MPNDKDDQMFVVEATDRNGHPNFALNPDDYNSLLTIGFDAETNQYWFDGQAPGLVRFTMSRNQFHQYVNNLVYWLLGIDQEYLSP